MLFRSKFEIKNNKIIENLCKNYIYIDTKYLKEIYEIFCNENKINPNEINEQYDKNINLYINNISNIKMKSEISKKISILLKCKSFENIIKNYKENVKYYLPFSIDFRGRKYDLTELSPTFFSEIRYCIHKGIYDFEKDILDHKNKKNIEIEIEKYFYTLYDIKKYNFINEKKEIKIAII